MADPPSGGRTGVKICGVTRREDAAAAVQAGADFVGAILSPGFGRSVQPEHAATYPLDRPGGGARLVAVMVDPTVEEAVEVARRSGASVLQLHGNEPAEVFQDLRTRGPWSLWKAVKVRTEADVDEAIRRYAGVVDALLLDGAPAGAAGGGHGARFPWEVAATVRASLPPAVSLVVAGGLAPDNVREAIARLRPDVVDVSSGVEAAHGRKDPEAIRAFVSATRTGAGDSPRSTSSRPAGAGNDGSPSGS